MRRTRRGLEAQRSKLAAAKPAMEIQSRTAAQPHTWGEPRVKSKTPKSWSRTPKSSSKENLDGGSASGVDTVHSCLEILGGTANASDLRSQSAKQTKPSRTSKTFKS